MIRLTISMVFLFFVSVVSTNAYTRIFFEDFETTTFTEHFLEDKFGSDTLSYWNEFKAEITQSSTSYDGSYSLLNNPYQTRNPYSQVGIGPVDYGNLSDFDLSGYANRYWFFRWYVRWSTPNNTTSTGGGNKIFYIGCGGDYFYLSKTADNQTGFAYMLRSEINGTILSSGWPSHGANLYDSLWHRVEVYVDFGSSNAASDGSLWVKIDDLALISLSSLDFDSLPTPIDCIAWPSNCTGCTGSQEIRYDNMSIYTLSSASDIPPLDTAEDELEMQIGTGSQTITPVASGGLTLTFQ